MVKGIDIEKCYADAVLSLFENDDFKNVSAETIRRIADYAVDYAQAGYDRGYDDGSLRIDDFVCSGKMDSIEKADRLIEVATAYKNNEKSKEVVSIKFPDFGVHVKYDFKIKPEDFKAFAEEIGDVIKRF